MLDRLRELQEDAAMMAHLLQAEGGDRNTRLAMGWLTISENYKMNERIITALAQGRMN